MTQPQNFNSNNIDNTSQTSSYAYPYGSYGANPSAPSITAKNTLPAFLNKLFGMVNASETDPWVHWNDDGTSFIIPSAQDLAEHVLGRHFKHNNFASFVRQLNMYGFHKVPHLNHGVLHNDGLPEVWEFTNENFQRDRPENMKYIVRKKGEAEKARSAAKQRSTSPTTTSPVFGQHPINDTMDVAIVRAEVQNVASRQKMIREEVCRLASSQESLWKYALETRQRYQDQQDKIDKIIKFLSEAFRKRPSPAMANSELPNKVRGLIEPAQRPSVFEELSDANTPSTQTPLSPMPDSQTQVDVMKMLANGKVPVGFHEAVQQYLLNMNNQNGNGYGTTPYATTPLTPTTSPTFDSSDALIQATAFNNAQLGNVQTWLNSEDQNISGLGTGLGIDLNSSSDLTNPTGNINYMETGNPDYTSYLNDAHFQLDPFVTNADPTLDMFSTESLNSAWPQYFDTTDSTQDVNAFGAQKRTYDENAEEEYPSSAKRLRT